MNMHVGGAEAQRRFKAGDKVVAIENDFGIEEGKEYTVAGYAETTTIGQWVYLSEISNHVSFDGSFVERRFSPAGLTIREGRYYRTRDGRKVGPMEGGGEAHDTGETVLGAKVEGAQRLWRAEGGGHLFDWDYLDLIAEWQDEPAPATTPTTAKFKVGDRVRVKGDPWREGHEGRAATIARIVDGYSPPAFTAVVDDTDGFDWFFDPDQLDAITTNPAIVARIDNGQPLPATLPHVHASVTDASKEATRRAKANPGREFAVYEMVHSVSEEPTYDHEWMRLAAIGQKIDAIKEVRGITGMTLKGAKDAVEHWLAVNAA